MASAEGRVGELSFSDAQFGTVRLDKRGNAVVVGGGGMYQEAAYRKRAYTGANQGPGGTTTTVGLAATYTGLCISNNITSTVNLAIYNVGVSVVGAPTALSTVGLMAGAAVTNVTHSTPLVARNNFWSLSNVTGLVDGVGLVDSSATLPNAPFLVHAFGTIPVTGATAQVVNPPFSGVSYDFNGSLILGPGAYAAIYTSTVLTIIGSIQWAELPL